MARYGIDYGHEFEGWGRGGRQEGWGGYGGGRQGSMGYGGMRSDRWGPEWQDVQGEGRWYSEGGRGFSGGYDSGYGGGGGYSDRGRYGAERWSRGMGGGYGSEYEMGDRPGSQYGGYGYGAGGSGGYGAGGYGGGGYGGGYAGRDLGYGGGMGAMGGQSGSRQRMRVADLMTENPECVTPDTTLTDAARKMRDLDVGIIPVVDSMENRRLQGVITDRDIAVRAVAEGKDGKARVSDFMTDDVETCNKNDGVEQVLDVMRTEQVRRVPITDREGRLVGIIAQADLLIDYAEDDHQREKRVNDAIERISEPARAESGGRMAARGRGGQQGGGMSGQGRQTGQGTTGSQGTGGQGSMGSKGRQGGSGTESRSGQAGTGDDTSNR